MELALAAGLSGVIFYGTLFSLMAFWPSWISHSIASAILAGVLILAYVGLADSSNDSPGIIVVLPLYLFVAASTISGAIAGTLRLIEAPYSRVWFPAICLAGPLWVGGNYALDMLARHFRTL